MIQLINGLVMTADENQYIVGRLNESRRKAAQGGRKDKLILNPRYYPTVAQAVSAALVRVMRHGVADGSITTLRQFIQEQERLQSELEKLVAPLDNGKE